MNFVMKWISISEALLLSFFILQPFLLFNNHSRTVKMFCKKKSRSPPFTWEPCLPYFPQTCNLSLTFWIFQWVHMKSLAKWKESLRRWSFAKSSWCL